MSWGTELWDQYDNIAAHTLKGIEFLEKYGNFVRDRCAIETEYAAKLRRLVKTYQPKKKEEDECQFSSHKAFKDMLNELNDQAGQHEVVAENLTLAIFKELATMVKDLKEERKKALQDGARLQANLAQQMQVLDRAHKNYEKAFREAERADEAYRKADADLNLSRAEVEKHRMTSSIKSRQCEDLKNEYAKQLQKTNELQVLHYANQMPAVFFQLQEMDEKRIKQLGNAFRKSVDIERSVFPIINTCLDGIIRAADQIDVEHDIRLVIERYKSGFQPPEDIPFEDLNHSKTNGSDNGSVTSSTTVSSSALPSLSNNLTTRGTLSANKLKKRAGIFGIFSSNKEDFSDLPPNQRRKKLLQKLDEINSKIAQETLTRDGLMKMKGVYEQNRALGDPLSVEGQLAESGQRLDRLRVELHKFQVYLDEAEGRSVPTPIASPNQNLSTGNKRMNGSSKVKSIIRRNSGSDESLSRSASDSSVAKPSAPGTPQPSHGSSHSPESGLGLSHTSLQDSEPDHEDSHLRRSSNAYSHNGQDQLYYNTDLGEEDVDTGNSDFDVDLLPVLGTCRAMYHFEAQSEGSIPMHEGEELYVIEVDQGDGWTRVRRISEHEEGFVPTSYIECTLYNNC